jgi:hypothetical protein
MIVVVHVEIGKELQIFMDFIKVVIGIELLPDAHLFQNVSASVIFLISCLHQELDIRYLSQKQGTVILSINGIIA